MTKLQRRNTASARLTAVQVMEIRQRYADGETQGALGREFGITAVQVGRIVRNESWQSLPATPPTKQEIEHSLSRLMEVQIAAERERAARRDPDRLLSELKGEENEQRRDETGQPPASPLDE